MIACDYLQSKPGSSIHGDTIEGGIGRDGAQGNPAPRNKAVDSVGTPVAKAAPPTTPGGTPGAAWPPTPLSAVSLGPGILSARRAVSLAVTGGVAGLEGSGSSGGPGGGGFEMSPGGR